MLLQHIRPGTFKIPGKPKLQHPVICVISTQQYMSKILIFSAAEVAADPRKGHALCNLVKCTISGFGSRAFRRAVINYPCIELCELQAPDFIFKALRSSLHIRCKGKISLGASVRASTLKLEGS